MVYHSFRNWKSLLYIHNSPGYVRVQLHVMLEMCYTWYRQEPRPNQLCKDCNSWNHNNIVYVKENSHVKQNSHVKENSHWTIWNMHFIVGFLWFIQCRYIHTVNSITRWLVYKIVLWDLSKSENSWEKKKLN